MTLNLAPGLNSLGYYKFCLCEDLTPIIILEKSHFTNHKEGGWGEGGSTAKETFTSSK